MHYSIRTEDAYVQWIKRFILFHGKRHPLEMGEREVEAFLTHLAVAEDVAASTQNQAMSALLFLDKIVLDRLLTVALMLREPAGRTPLRGPDARRSPRDSGPP